jgi:hypothetical protein
MDGRSFDRRMREALVSSKKAGQREKLLPKPGRHTVP